MDHGRTFTDMERIGQCDNWLVVRTDFSDAGAWEAMKKEILKPSKEDGFLAYVDFLEDGRHEGRSRDQLLSLIDLGYDGYSCGYIVIADKKTMQHEEHPLLVVDLDPDGVGEFRCVPGEMHAVENNLSTGNMDFEDFVRVLDADGVFRGNWENAGLYLPKPEAVRRSNARGGSTELRLVDEEEFRVMLPGNMKISRTGDVFLAERGFESFMVNLMQNEDFFEDSRRTIQQKNLSNSLFEVTLLKQGQAEGSFQGIEVLRHMKNTSTGKVSAHWIMLLDLSNGRKATVQVSIDPYIGDNLAQWKKVVESLEFE